MKSKSKGELYVVIVSQYDRCSGGDFFLELLHSEGDLIEYLKDLMCLGKYIIKNEENEIVDIVDNLKDIEEDINRFKYSIVPINTLKIVKERIDGINGDGCDYIKVYKILFGGLRKIEII